MSALRILLTLSFCFIFCFASSQNTESKIIRKFGITEGLSHGVVNTIAQDKKGFIWLGTEDGLNRFDGYGFSPFKFDTHCDVPFHDNYIQNVLADEQGNLWVSSRRGLYRFDISTEKFIPFVNDKPFSNDISFITNSSDGNLWLSFYGGGFGYFDEINGRIITYNQQTLPSLTTRSTIVSYEDTYGLLWNGSQDLGLNVYKTNGDTVANHVPDLSGVNILPSLYVKCIIEDHLGNIWIGTTKGLSVYLRSRNEFVTVPLSDNDLTTKGIYSLLQDSNKILWIGTLSEGLYAIDLKGFDDRQIDKITYQHIQKLDRYNISRTTIKSIYEDRDKNIWLGTHGDGVFMIGAETKQFNTISVKEVLGSAETYVSFNGLCLDKFGHIWAGTNGSGIFKFSKDGTILKHYVASAKPGDIKDNVILSVREDADDNLWFGTSLSGVFRYDRETDSFIQYVHELSNDAAPLSSHCRVLFEDSKKNMWVGTARAGICILDKKSGQFKYFPDNKGFRDIDARAFVEDKRGDLWIGCYGGGLVHYDVQNNKITRYFDNTETGNPLKSNFILSMALDAKGDIWLGSGGGLAVFNPARKTLKRYGVEHGLLNNIVLGVKIDDSGNIWVSTIRGVSKFYPETEHFVNYTYFDGLQEGQFNPGSTLYNPIENYICFGGALGINIFDPQKVSSELKAPKVMISGLQLFNKKVNIGDQNNLLEKVIDETKQITLTSKQSVFTFEFTALNYNYPQKNRYAYKLEGIDKDWNPAGNSRSATYRYLQPGDYTFKVKATAQENEWPKEYASIQVKILPPFWRTPIAYLLYIVCIGFVSLIIYKNRKKQKQLNRRLRVENALRLRQRQMVQEKLSFFTEVSHEFRTPLTLIIGPMEEILTRESIYTPLGKKLKVVYNNAHKLLNLINKLLDYRKAESGSMVLRVKEDNIVSFCEEIFINFKELARRKRIDFKFTSTHDEIKTWFDKEKLEMVLNNILSNSFKYIGSGNHIVVSVTSEKSQNGVTSDEHIVIKISDNGIGIPQEKLKYIFDWFYQADNTSPVSSGIGLALAKKLIHLHKGLIYVTSNEGQGSVFTIKIPIGKEHFVASEVVVDESAQQILPVNHNREFEDEYAEPHATRKKGLKTILIVEDDQEIREFLKGYFEETYRILEAHNGREAIDIAVNGNPDLIISDVMMPEMNGIDFCKYIKHTIKTSHIPVLLLTAKTAFTHHKEGLEIGADAYITKPFSPDMLGLTVDNLLQSHENVMRFYRSRFIQNGSEQNEAVSIDEKFLQKIYDLVRRNLENTELSLEDVCEELNISKSLLYKKIKSLTGLSPVEYVRSLRLAEAANLLKSGKYKVYEVVYKVGFTDIKYFRKCFQKEFGFSPSTLLEKQV